MVMQLLHGGNVSYMGKCFKIIWSSELFDRNLVRNVPQRGSSNMIVFCVDLKFKMATTIVLIYDPMGKQINQFSQKLSAWFDLICTNNHWMVPF